MRKTIKKQVKYPGPEGQDTLPYEPNIHNCDIVEPYQDLMKDSPFKEKIGKYYKDVFLIPDHEEYERIISIAVLEHLEDLPRVVAKCGLLLHASGSFRAGIPNEGTLL